MANNDQKTENRKKTAGKQKKMLTINENDDLNYTKQRSLAFVTLKQIRKYSTDMQMTYLK